MRYVITGGPGVGKTTTCSELARLGHTVVSESARAIIAQEQAKEHGILPWTDLYRFQELVLDRQLSLEARLNGMPAFLDRGLVDNIAYCRIGRISPPPLLEHHARQRRYDRVFLLDPLPDYRTDGERKEDLALARRLHETIGQAYRDYGYTVERVPVLPIPQRAQYIVEKTT